MAVPKLISVNPGSGSTLGRELVEIRGINFRLPDPPPATGPVAAAGPTVEVEFDGVPATDLAVITQGRLLALTPPHAETKALDGSKSAIDVTVRNLDNNGDPIVGEEATKTGAFTYGLTDLTVDADVTRVCRVLRRMVRDQVHPNTRLIAVHTDWAEDPDNALRITNIATFPAIVLEGPELLNNRFYSTNEYTLTDLQAGGYQLRREPKTVDLGFEVVVLSDRHTELINLIDLLERFFHKNKFVTLDDDPNDPSVGSTDFELDFQDGGDLRVATEPNNSNLRQARGSILIRGFDISVRERIEQGAELGQSQIPGTSDPDGSVTLECSTQVMDNLPQAAKTGQPVASPGPGGDC